MFGKFIFIQRSKPFVRLLAVAALIATSVFLGEVIRPFGVFPLNVIHVPVPILIQLDQGDCLPPQQPYPKLFHASMAEEG